MPLSIKSTVFLLFFKLSLVLLLASSAFSVFAQSTGVSIKPATFEKTVDPGQVMPLSFTIENLNATDQTFYLFTRNISGVRDGGAPIFVKSNAERTGYELADWIDLSSTQISVPGSSAVAVSYVLSVPEGASPGSHFGGIFVSAEPPEIENSGAAVGYQVANIISLRVSGEAVEQANIRQFSTGKYLYGSQNIDFDVRIENTGNVLVKPVGPLEIRNMLGNKVGSVIFNEQQAGVFPYSTREFNAIKWEGDSVGFGRYEAILSPGYGDTGAKKTMSSTVTFWILPINIIGPVAGVLAFLLIVTFIFVRMYIKRSLEHLNHGRRMVRRRRKSGSSATLLLLVVMLTVTALFLVVVLALFA